MKHACQVHHGGHTELRMDAGLFTGQWAGAKLRSCDVTINACRMHGFRDFNAAARSATKSE